MDTGLLFPNYFAAYEANKVNMYTNSNLSSSWGFETAFSVLDKIEFSLPSSDLEHPEVPVGKKKSFKSTIKVKY